MARVVIHAGGAGAGQAAKICNNMVLGVSMLGVCEAFGLAEKLGLGSSHVFVSPEGQGAVIYLHHETRRCRSGNHS